MPAKQFDIEEKELIQSLCRASEKIEELEARIKELKGILGGCLPHLREYKESQAMCANLLKMDGKDLTKDLNHTINKIKQAIKGGDNADR